MAKKATPPGKPDIEDEGKTRDGAENGSGSIADRADAEELPIPESKPLGEKGGQIALPGTPAQRKKPVEIVVELGSGHTKGAGPMDVDEEQLLIVRAEYKEGVPRPKRDSDRQIIGWKYIHKLRPTWVESLDDFLAANGMKIVRVDEEGEAVDTSSLTDIEAIRREQEGAGPLS